MEYALVHGDDVTVRNDVAQVIQDLLRASDDDRRVSLDAIGESIGTRAFSTDDIDQVLNALEREGRTVTWQMGGGVSDLRVVLTTARLLASELGRRPAVAEIAARAGLEPVAVRTALSLAQVMGRTT